MGHETAVECRPEEMQRQADPPFSLVLFPALSPAQVKLIVAGVISGLSELLREHPKALACTNTEHLRQEVGLRTWMMADEALIRFIFKDVERNDAERVAGMLKSSPELLSSIWMTRTLLTHAAWEGHLSLVSLLLEKGAGVDTSDASGRTALHIAAVRGHEVIVAFLLSCCGADIRRRGYGSQTALMYASLNGHLAVALWILGYMEGRGMNESDDNGRTALWHASYRGHAHIVSALLLAGADHTIADNSGDTPHDVALACPRPQCPAIFQWWKGELQRAYSLHKARTLHEGTTTRQQAPAAPVPAYLSPRVLGGSAIMPSVEVGTGAGKGKRARGGQDGMASYYNQVEVEEEEMAAMVGFVVKDLATELYTELLAGLHQGTAGM